MKFSIRYKFAVGLLLIFYLSFNIMNLFISNIIIKNNQKVISNELLSNQKDINIFLKQYFLINGIKANQADFEENGAGIASALALKLNNRIVLYKNDGNILWDTDYNEGKLFLEALSPPVDDKKDLNLAVAGKASYKIVKLDGEYKIIYSEPLYVDNASIGILRYSNDCTELFNSGNDIIFKLKMFMILMFSLLFIFSYLLCTRITIPIIKLNKSTKKMSQGNFDFEVTAKSKDEIGDLSNSFNIMKEKIKVQIETIERNRENLIKIENHRKTFFDNVTHEMKTPITIIDGYADMILTLDSLDEKIINKAASKIKKESNKLHKMISGILNMSKLQSSSNYDNIERLDVKSIVNEVCEDMAVKAGKYEIIIEKNLEEAVYIMADKSDIWKLVVNILDNSIKYGNVKSVIEVNVWKEENNCNITVSDGGEGINEEVIEKVFEPFYRKNNVNIEGTGLGLSIVKRVVEKYKGKIEIESKVNKGTTVYIKIPLILQDGNNFVE